MHKESFHEGHPAVNVKVQNLPVDTSMVVNRFHCSEEVAQKALNFAWELACRTFWKYWTDPENYKEYFQGQGFDVTTGSEGRSAGWLVVYGLPNIEDWDDSLHEAWTKFEKEVHEDIAYRTSEENIMGDISANRWAEDLSEEYNFIDTPNGNLCLVDFKKKIDEFAMENFGITVYKVQEKKG